MQPRFYSNRKFALSRNLKVGVLCGGTSSERKVSLRSGRAVYQAFRRLGIPVAMLDPARPEDVRERIKKVQVAFIALHGHGGEDGTIQRFLDRKKIPYIGSDAKGSLNAFDKEITKRCCDEKGIPTAPYRLIKRPADLKKLKGFSAPVVIKPICNGSSVGVFMVEDIPRGIRKIREALRKYEKLIVEKKIEGREFTVGIFGNRPLPVIELVPKRSFYDYQAKYTKGMTEYLVPAPIERSTAKKLQKIALKLHRSLGLRDFSRIDMMMDEAGNAYVLEANSIPGLTELSLLPKAARAAGISFEALCERLIQWAYKRGRQKGVCSHHGKKTS